jgi:uncharacterized protein YihD (DUF1040 family)
MRDPNRIGDVLQAVEKIWRRYPDMRLGQLISNLADWSEQSVWDIEEDDLVAEIERHIDNNERLSNGVAATRL